MSLSPATALRFGTVEIRPRDRKLLIHGEVIPLGTRAFDLLVCLAERHDRCVRKADLMALVWPDSVVEENNLTVQISVLRKVLGRGAIRTVSGRGYCFALLPDPKDAALGAQNPDFSDEPSIAVLPFVNLGADSAYPYFVGGINEDIITELSRFQSLLVISRSSCARYAGQAQDVPTVARELGVRYVLEGTVRSTGQRVRVTAQLIAAATGINVWAEKYDGTLDDVFQMQDDIVRNITTAIAVGIERSERTRVRRQPQDLSVHEVAMRAWNHAQDGWSLNSPNKRDQAVAQAELALLQDRDNFLALSALAFALWQHVFFRTARDHMQAMRSAMAAAQQLIALDPTDERGYRFRGLLLVQNQAWDEARSCLLRSYQYNPSEIRALNALGFVEITLGHHAQGIAHLQRSLRLSPRDPALWATHVSLSMGYFSAQDYQRTLYHAQRCLEEVPGVVTAHLNQAVAYVGLGQLPLAVAALARARQAAPAFVADRLQGNTIHRDSQVRQRYLEFLHRAAAAELTIPDSDGAA